MCWGEEKFSINITLPAMFCQIIRYCLLLPLLFFRCNANAQVGITRLNNNQPIIDRTMPSTGWNINGPSMIRIPDWIPPESRADSSANYYLYFANHHDLHIKMAWSSEIAGPYTIYDPGNGVFHLDNYDKPSGLEIFDHVASPDVQIDHENKRFIMYFHAGILEWKKTSINGQKTVVAVSEKGLNFNKGLQDVIICPFYARIFDHKQERYALCKDGIYMAPDYEDPWDHDQNFNKLNPHLWKKISDPFAAVPKNERHFTVLRNDNILHVMFSRYPTAPEHIEYSIINLEKPEQRWKATKPIDILFPEYEWEGILYPIEPSLNGTMNQVHELRDPFLFKDDDEMIYLLYTGGGEEAIGIAGIDGLLHSENPFENKDMACPDSLKVFPNPSPDGIVNVSGIEERAVIEVYSITGQVLIENHISDVYLHQVDLTNFSEEIVLIHIRDGIHSCWFKVINTLRSDQ
ncbi:MAG: hypothetical protein K9J30_12080 [Bacteroidales bacterium]|nr:hypothetical protein [Bacteroidales bacterium]